MSKEEERVDIITPRKEHIVAVSAKQAVEGISVTLSDNTLSDEAKLYQSLELINFYRAIYRATNDPHMLDGWQ